MIIQGKRVFIGGLFMPAQIKIEGSRIAALQRHGSEKADEDYGEAIIAPGFIDVHTHGAYGYSADTPDADGLASWLEKLPAEGVTGVLPSTTSQFPEATENALANIAAVHEKKPLGAQIIGAHTEGPMLDHDYRGAHEPKKLHAPSIELFDRYQQASRGLVKYLTLAIEHDSGFCLTQHASRCGAVVSIGHSGASMEEAMLAIGAGATSFTHTFNAMSPLHHRTPGVVGAAMASNVFAEIIGDGHHVQPNIANILFKAHNNKMILVSDSLLIKGLPRGTYSQEGQSIDVTENGTAVLSGTNTLAGSTLQINRGVEMLVKQAMVSLEHALLAAAFNPACALGITNTKGQLRAGNDADIVVLADDFSVVQTYCLGRAML